MPHRDPQTGQFVSDAKAGGYEHVEYLTFQQLFSVPASALSGTTDQFYGEGARFEGVLLYDVDDIIDRHEIAHLVTAEHHLDLQPTGTQTADSAAFASVEVSGSPSRDAVQEGLVGQFEGIADYEGDWQPQTDGPSVSDSADIVGRPLSAMAQGPFTDGTNGLGGGGGPGWDDTAAEPLDFDMDRRDEMYINGIVEAQNISDGPITFAVTGRHVYGIEET